MPFPHYCRRYPLCLAQPDRFLLNNCAERRKINNNNNNNNNKQQQITTTAFLFPTVVDRFATRAFLAAKYVGIHEKKSETKYKTPNRLTFPSLLSTGLLGATRTFLGEVSGSMLMMFWYKIFVTLALSSVENWCRRKYGGRNGRTRVEHKRGRNHQPWSLFTCISTYVSVVVRRGTQKSTAGTPTAITQYVELELQKTLRHASLASLRNAENYLTMSVEVGESPGPPPSPPPVPPAAPMSRSSLNSAELTAFIICVILASSWAKTSGSFDRGATGCVLLSTWQQREHGFFRLR